MEGASADELIRDAAHRIAQDIEPAPGVLKPVFVELVDLGGKHIHFIQEHPPGLRGASGPVEE